MIDRDVEVDNIRLGWSWAAEQGRAQCFLKIHRGLGELYELSGRYQEGFELFKLSVGIVGNIYYEIKTEFDAGQSEIGQMYGNLLAWQSWFALRLGQFEQAQTLLHQALSIASEDAQETPWGQGFPLYQLGMIDWYVGHYVSARQYLGQALTISKQTEGSFITCSSLTQLGLTEMALGNYQAARRIHEECLAVCRKMDVRGALGVQYNCLGILSYLLEDYTQAGQYLEQGLDICREAKHLSNIAQAQTFLGLVNWRLGKAEQGKQLCQESLDIFNEIGERYGQALALDHLGQITWAMGAYQESQNYFRQALDIGQEIKSRPQNLSAQIGLARGLLRSGQTEQAAQLLADVADDPASEYVTQENARRLLAEMQAQLEPQASRSRFEKVAVELKRDNLPTFLGSNDAGLEGISEELLSLNQHFSQTHARYLGGS